MIKILNRSFLAFNMLILIAMFNSSCSTTKKVKYFQDIPDSGVVKTIPAAAFTDSKIKGGDVLNVIIQTLTPSATQDINAGNAASVQSPATNGLSTPSSTGLSNLNQVSTLPGYTVDKDGSIDLPVLGKVKAEGLTIAELHDFITDAAAKYYKNPIVTVKYANFTVSITGEVARPGVYVMPTEKVSLMNALAMAGDLTIFGKRENVLLLRENPDGSKTAYRINLKKSDVLSSPLYYMHQNDILYIEPRSAKSDATDAQQQRYFALASTFLSLLIVLSYRIKL